VKYEKVFRYLINGDFEDKKSSTEIETSAYLEIYMYAAAHRWMEVVEAARSKIVSSNVNGVLKKLAVVVRSAVEIKDTKMLEF
jgi:hypothetical protein